LKKRNARQSAHLEAEATMRKIDIGAADMDSRKLALGFTNRRGDTRKFESHE
jgi:hypothetical protein